MSAENKIMAARASLVLEDPFFGSLALNLPAVPDRNIQTLCTNGRVMKYNPAFIDTLTHDRIKACIAHEVMHVANGHPWRRDERNPRGWNIACDKPINHELREAGFRLPDGVLYATGDEIGKSAEWIYARMEEQPSQQNPSPQPEPQGGAGDGGDGNEQGDSDQDDQDSDQDGSQRDQGDSGEPDPLGEVEDAPKGPDENGEPAPTEQEWKEKVMVAITQAQLAGKLPAGIARQLQDALQPRIDVHSLLLRFFSERANSDYSWSQPNRRYLAQGLYMPALESHSLGEVAVMVDTSGSVDDVSLQYARGILQKVIDECNPAGVTLYFVDTKVSHVERLEKGDPLTWTPKGGGGTDFTSFFDQVERGEIEPACVVCITDLYATFPQVAPSVPVMWLSTTKGLEAPFGETVYVDQ
ncbi:MAG: VWA-like domain-containing protein [Acidobacteriaceae bacterium]